MAFDSVHTHVSDIIDPNAALSSDMLRADSDLMPAAKMTDDRIQVAQAALHGPFSGPTTAERTREQISGGPTAGPTTAEKTRDRISGGPTAGPTTGEKGFCGHGMHPSETTPSVHKCEAD